ncbi:MULTISPECIES: winged helix-turn-helix domain-containing protein [Tenebrionibacter/Tenebrionicola group]|jgi:DNA-binding winged helix-turn-helix (wHTH) protein|uniref:Winged helix-turn-helix domain-containing protein n=2 Tax=Tenebrionibacter/Tenebrionicola group TaxID=2969848 RepID=A0A8K0V8R8_9ENTR|nr:MULTISPECIES: winged helix-turn-helix domain-containing protein [Tenebrionibacter/Tenebrionicola group]MBK4716275.1 winged helix-turn-helix domain-containing protein [Tenebrionibacter intestinalis]MBV4412158.1 winged helix-turn-helix domain-containing protein [Tenebrionicola larvae]MBV5097114.1 winged helix-turn-helix domain-containing protein [Tenebrionicola larvae]
MCFIYRLNDSIEFRPDDNRLINLHNTQQQVTLSASCARCLLLLVKKRDLVTQHELFNYAWGDNAISATPNNLYQNISLLRKALKGLTSHDNAWIVTLPRKGFQLDDNVTIEEIAAPEAASSSTSVADEMPPVAPAPPPPSAGLLMTWFKYKKTLIFTWVVFITLLAASLTAIDYFMFPHNAIAQRYIYYKDIEACKIYLNKDAYDSVAYRKVLGALEVSCKHNPYTYITVYPILHTATALSCTAAIGHKHTQCISSIIRGFK